MFVLITFKHESTDFFNTDFMTDSSIIENDENHILESMVMDTVEATIYWFLCLWKDTEKKT